jgi:phage baseplate assembly protein W
MSNQINNIFNPIPRNSPLRKRETLYADFRKDLLRNPLTNDLALLTDEQAVKESLKNLILIDAGERLFQPDIGGSIRALLFENSTPALTKIVEERIRDIINNYEPRVVILNIEVFSLDDNNLLRINIYFYIINREEPLSLTVLLERTR